MNKFIIALSILLQLVFISVRAKELVLNQLSVEQGLTYNYVTDILQDKSGFIWIATLNGLNRFDGNRVINYFEKGAKTEGLDNDRIPSICEDIDGNIWISCSFEGISVFDTKKEKYHKITLDSLNHLSNFTTNIHRTNNGDMLIGTRSGELFRIKKSEISKITTGEAPQLQRLEFKLKNSPSVNRIVETVQIDGHLWLRDWMQNLFKVQYNNDHALSYTIEFIAPDVNNIQRDSKGVLYVCSKKGLKRYEIAEGFQLSYSEWPTIKGTENQDVLNCIIDDADNAWAVMRDSGIVKFSNISSPTPKLEQYSTVINGARKLMFIDRSNTLWISTTREGAYYGDVAVKTFNKLETFQSYYNGDEYLINSSIYDSRGNLWGSGLDTYMYVKKHDSKDEEHIVESIFASDFFEDDRQQLWIASRDGVYRYPITLLGKESVKNYKIDFSKWNRSDLNGILFNSVDEDHFNNIWLSTDKDLIYLILDNQLEITDVKVFSRDVSDALYPCDIQIIRVHPVKNQLWVMQRGCGVSVLSYEEGINSIKYDNYNINRENGHFIPSKTVNNIMFDKDNVWLCSDHGLIKLYFDETAGEYLYQKCYTTEEGLSHNIALSAIRDDENFVWIGTNYGLSCLDIEKDKIISFASQHLLRSNVFTKSAQKLKDGSLAFGTEKGFVTFDPSEIFLNEKPPKVVFTGLSVYNEPVLPGQEIRGNKVLLHSLNNTKHIEINYKQNDFTIDFAALHYAFPDANKFSYFLQGYSDKWINTDQKRAYAKFSNLNAGKYKLLVKASNNDGLWTEETTQLGITVLPPPWKTIWAYLLYTLIIALIVYLTLKFWKGRVQLKNEILLERKGREADAMINNMKTSFFTDISHEFRTPLTLIVAPVRELIDKFKNDETILEKLVPLGLNVNRMLRLIDQLLDFRKLETGNLKLNVRNDNIVETLKAIKGSFDNVAKRKSISFRFESSIDELQTVYDADKVDKIVHNLLSNAFKFTPKGGQIILNLREIEDDHIEIKVKDNGAGITSDDMPKIFDRFFQTSGSEGTGIGLALAKEMVELHKGKITAESTPGVETTFTVVLAVGNDHFFNEVQLQKVNDGYESLPVWLSSSLEEAHFNEKELQESEKPLILIVEDNLEISSYIEHLLNKDFRAMVAIDGKVGLEYATKYLPDIIISDIRMPEMDGIEMCRLLKEDSVTSHIPLLFLTAKTSEQDKITGLNVGSTDYIRKPFDPVELKLKVENVLKNQQQVKDHLKKSIILSPSSVEIESPEEAFLVKAVKVVEENMSSGEFNLVNLCEELGVSRMQLHRKLKTLTGQSTTEFIRSIRLKRAAQLLETGHMNVVEVMYEVGIESSSYFSKAFKSQFGLPPAAYMKKHGKS